MAEQEEDPHTGQVWDNFAPYPLEQRGSQDVPNRFLKNTHWREDQGSDRYYTRDHLCWVELHYSRRDGNWNAFCIAEADLGLQIPFSELTPEERLRLLGAGAVDEEESEESGREESRS